jgi:formiminoglutamate deiminase
MTDDRVLRFDQALTPDGWQSEVAIRIGADGIIRSVMAGAADGERIAGAAVPGVANVHSHAFQRAMAGLTEIAGHNDDDFWSWRELMYRFLARISPEDAEAIAAFAYMEMLEGGFTTVTEFHYLHHQPDGTAYDDPAEMSHRHAAAAGETGIGLTLLPVFYAHADFGGKPPADGQRRFISRPDDFARLVESAARSVPPGRLGLAPHSFRAVTPEELRLVDAMLPDGPRHIHVSEQTKEVRDCFAAHGVTPIRLLAETVDLSPQWCLIHCTHATPEDLTLIAFAGAVAGLCPVTEANLGDGIFPAAEFLAKGGRFGIGTDSNILIGLPDELRQLEYSQRLLRRSRNVLAPRGGSTGLDLFSRALAGGAQAAGLGVHGLRAGAQADIVVLDAARPDWAAADAGRLIDSWVFAAARPAVRDVFAQGRHVVMQGRHRGRDQIERAYSAALRRITQA